jgi:hypothetical protein
MPRKIISSCSRNTELQYSVGLGTTAAANPRLFPWTRSLKQVAYNLIFFYYSKQCIQQHEAESLPPSQADIRQLVKKLPAF